MATPLMKKKVNWKPVADLTVKEIFGSSCTVGEMNGSLWKVIKKNDLLEKSKN